MWEIKDKANQTKATVRSLEYNGEWMGESYVSITVESPAPINFEIGDYVIYRDERFEINYDPGKIKSAPRFAKGDAFKYENIKFNSLADELTRCSFRDVVLEDNQVHFTGLPKFSFYGGVRDLANRMQANLNRTYGKGTWEVVVSDEYTDMMELNVSVDTQNVWDALSTLVNDFEAYFTIKGRTITIGAAGVPANHLFTYGKGNGLYEIEQTAETDQAIVTRLRAYGSTRNLPHRYYNNLPAVDRANAPIHSIVTREYINSGVTACALSFRLLSQYVDLTKCLADGDRYWFAVSVNGIGYAAYWDSNTEYYTIGHKPPSTLAGVSNTILRAEDMALIDTGTIVSFENYKEGAPGIVKSIGIPDNMAVQNLMLPDFPYVTQDPYIDSPNIASLGIREGTVFFDGSGELEEIYPSIEGMTAEQLEAAGVPCNSEGELDVLVDATEVADNGVGKIEGDNSTLDEKDACFTVRIKDIGFDINDYLIEGNSEVPTISFKSGMLGGREFEIVGCKKIESNGKVTGYELELNRVYDDGIKLWFPYASYNAKAGDKFVLLYIEMPEVYIKAASQRLKEAAEEWLSKNDYSRSIYAPKIDEIFMARQHDLAMASGGKIKSLHDTLKEGMLLLFEDEDLNIDASIFIDRLTIKEGDSPIPTYEVVLKEEKTVGRLDKMQNQIDSLAAGKGQSGGGYTAAQIRSMIEAYGDSRFLSKIKADRTPYALTVGGQLRAEADALVSRLLTAAGGVQFGESFASGLTGFGGFIDALGHGELRSLRLWKFLEVPELRYNRVTLVNRIQWATPGAGIIGSVIPDIRPDGTPDVTGTVILKLEEGEYGTLAIDDICMGIWHDTAQTDATSDDGRGNFVFRGFRTIYFRITGVSDDSKALRYMLRPGYTHHPSQGMHFAAYGNFTDKDRQKSRYMTDSYIRFLHDVDDWEFGELNIAAQFGDLSNLTIGGVAMKGYSIYMDNVYMSGTIHQIKVTPPVLTVDVEGGNGRDVAPGEEVAVTCRVTKAMTAFAGPVAWRVTRSTGDADADEAWDSGHAGFEGTLTLTYADLGGHWRPAFTVEAVCDDDGTPYTLRETVILRRTEAYVEDTGPWTAGRKYLDGTATDAQGRLVTHDAWLYGARWRCTALHTSDEGNRPGYGSQYWEYVGGIPDEFGVSFEQAYDNAPQDPRRPYIPLTVRAVYRGEDVTQYIADTDCEWSRYSENEAGEERTAMDAVWNAANRWRGKDTVFTEADCQTRYGGYPEGVGRLVFTVVVTLRDPGGDAPLARSTMSITAE